MVYSRTQFEVGDITTLLGTFTTRVQQYPAVEGVSQKDYEYVLTETGFADKSDFNFDEFIEVWRTFPLPRLAGFADSLQICGELTDIVFLPTPGALVAERLRIPVEKSGGGVYFCITQVMVMITVAWISTLLFPTSFCGIST